MFALFVFIAQVARTLPAAPLLRDFVQQPEHFRRMPVCSAGSLEGLIAAMPSPGADPRFVDIEKRAEKNIRHMECAVYNVAPPAGGSASMGSAHQSINPFFVRHTVSLFLAGSHTARPVQGRALRGGTPLSD